jgi:hypothetical protein
MIMFANEELSVGVADSGVGESSIDTQAVPLATDDSILPAIEFGGQFHRKLDDQSDCVVDRHPWISRA